MNSDAVEPLHDTTKNHLRKGVYAMKKRFSSFWHSALFCSFLLAAPLSLRQIQPRLLPQYRKQPPFQTPQRQIPLRMHRIQP